MTVSEYVEYLFFHSDVKESPIDGAYDFHAANLLSRSLVYPLYERLYDKDLPMETITDHLEAIYNKKDHYGLLYLIIMMAENAAVEIPKQFYEFSVQENRVPLLSAAIIEDWFDMAASYE